MHPLMLTLWLACQGLDAGSTVAALRLPGAYEANPLMAHGRVPIRLGVNLGAFLAYRKTKSKVIPLALAASGCTAGTLNLTKLKGG